MSQPFNELEQVEMSVEAAKNMIGSATMSMDPNQLKEATEILNTAKSQIQNVKLTSDKEKEVIAASKKKISDIEEQLREAKER